jgi:hypothetical protein
VPRSHRYDEAALNAGGAYPKALSTDVFDIASVVKTSSWQTSPAGISPEHSPIKHRNTATHRPTNPTVIMSGTPRGIGHALKEKLFPRSRKLSPQSTATSNSCSTPPAPTFVGSTSPSTLTTSQPSLQSPPSKGESALVYQHGVTILAPLQKPSSTSQPSLQSPTPTSDGEPSQHGIIISTPLQNASSDTAAHPCPSLWQRVHSIAKDQLSKKEREEFDLPTATGNDSIESAISAAKGAHKAAKDRRWVYRSKQGNDIVVMERVGRILRGMENYAKIGDILIQSSPEITALVWGAARFILQVSPPLVLACSN